MTREEEIQRAAKWHAEKAGWVEVTDKTEEQIRAGATGNAEVVAELMADYFLSREEEVENEMVDGIVRSIATLEASVECMPGDEGFRMGALSALKRIKENLPKLKSAPPPQEEK